MSWSKQAHSNSREKAHSIKICDKGYAAEKRILQTRYTLFVSELFLVEDSTADLFRCSPTRSKNGSRDTVGKLITSYSKHT